MSQTDVSSFGFTTSSDVLSGTTAVVKLLLSWNLEQWQCIINETIIESNKYYMCTSGDLNPNATLITNSLSSNTYEMKLELIGNNTNDLIRIERIRVVDDDSNYYDIDTFCLPKQFKQTEARGTSLESLECCYWSQRYSYNNYAMGNKQNAVLKISYAQFRSNVLNYPNQAHEGAIKPPSYVYILCVDVAIYYEAICIQKTMLIPTILIYHQTMHVFVIVVCLQKYSKLA